MVAVHIADRGELADRAYAEERQGRHDDEDLVLALDELMRKARAGRAMTPDLKNAEAAAGELRYWLARLS